MSPEQALPIPALESFAAHIIDPVEPGPPDILVGLLPKHGQCVIAGEANIGKSLIALEIVSSLNTGEPLWGQLEPTMRARRILFCLGEHYIGVIQNLWHDKLGRKLSMDDSVFIIGPEHLKVDKYLVQKGQQHLLAIEKFNKWTQGCDLVVFDPLAAFIAGDSDTENSAIPMRLLIDTMTSIAQSNGASCLILAHTGKPSMDQNGKEHSRTKYAIRGSSAIEDAATNVFYLREADGTAVGPMYDLISRKYKGQSQDRKLLRDPDTFTHTLVMENPYNEIQKLEANSKIAKLLADNPKMGWHTAVHLVATMEGVPDETIKRRIGAKR